MVKDKLITGSAEKDGYSDHLTPKAEVLEPKAEAACPLWDFGRVRAGC